MKFGQLIEYNKSNKFLQNSCRKWGRETSSRPFLFFIKVLYDIKASGLWSAAYFQYISIALILAYNKNKLYKTLDYWSRNMFNFEFLEKYLGIVSHRILYMVFQEKCFSCYIFLTDQVSFSDCLYFLRYWAISVLQMLVFQVVT